MASGDTHSDTSACGLVSLSPGICSMLRQWRVRNIYISYINRTWWPPARMVNSSTPRRLERRPEHLGVSGGRLGLPGGRVETVPDTRHHFWCPEVPLGCLGPLGPRGPLGPGASEPGTAGALRPLGPLRPWLVPLGHWDPWAPGSLGPRSPWVPGAPGVPWVAWE